MSKRKRFLLSAWLMLSVLGFLVLSSSSANASVNIASAFPDPVFREYVQRNFDGWGLDENGNMVRDSYKYADGILSDIEIGRVEIIKIVGQHIQTRQGTNISLL